MWISSDRHKNHNRSILDFNYLEFIDSLTAVRNKA